MPAIDQIRAHFNAHKVKVIEVPEWGGEDGRPLVIYGRPMTLAERQSIRNKSDRQDLEAFVYTLILKAEDAEGKKLFTIADKHALMHKADPDVVMRVALALSTPPTEEEAEKN